MRKRNSTKNKTLDVLFTNVGLKRKEWYTATVHGMILENLVHGSKLQAFKYLMDLSREKDGDGRYGLKNLKDFVDQFDHNVRQRKIALGLEMENTLPFNTQQIGNVIPTGTSDREILTDVIHAISNDIKYKSSTNGLRELLSHVPAKFIKEYWIGI